MLPKHAMTIDRTIIFCYQNMPWQSNHFLLPNFPMTINWIIILLSKQVVTSDRTIDFSYQNRPWQLMKQPFSVTKSVHDNWQNAMTIDGTIVLCYQNIQWQLIEKSVFLCHDWDMSVLLWHVCDTSVFHCHNWDTRLSMSHLTRK